MALNPMGVLDLSIVTQQLITLVEGCRDASPLWATLGSTGPTFTISVTGSSPDSVRKDGDCQVSVYLFHVQQNRFQRNSTVTGPRRPPPPFTDPLPTQRVPSIPAQPLSLDLYYLVTAFADKDFAHEQQAMSIVLRCFHENPIMRRVVSIPGTPPTNVPEEFTLTMEVETADELSRIWQAITVPSRLSVVYKVSVVFITPPAPPQLGPPPTEFRLAVDPAILPFAEAGQITGTLKPVRFASPNSTAANPEIVTYNLSPATVAPGQRLFVFGSGLDQTPRVFLSQPGQPEQDITAWKTPELVPLDPQFQTKSRMTLDVPSAAGSPAAGVYQLRAADAATYRTNATPVSVSARVDVTVTPPAPPLLLPVAGISTLAGAGFVSGDTEVLLDTIALRETGGAVAPGTFTVNVAGTSISFQPPAGLATGRYTVRVRVAKVESDPSWWIDV